jgi:hypothetical protein
MKRHVHDWYSAEFFLGWFFFSDCSLEKIKTHISYSITFLRKSCHLEDNVEKCVRARQATCDTVMRHIQDAICTPDKESKNTDTHTHSLYWILNTAWLLFIHHKEIPYVMLVLIASYGINCVRSSQTFYGSTYKNCNTAQRLVCLYSMFSQILRLKKAMSK